jgi:hypothetical protein
LSRTIVFHWSKGYGENNAIKEEVEYDENVADEEIQKDFEEWVWQQIGDSFGWYDKE